MGNRSVYITTNERSSFEHKSSECVLDVNPISCQH